MRILAAIALLIFSAPAVAADTKLFLDCSKLVKLAEGSKDYGGAQCLGYMQALLPALTFAAFAAFIYHEATIDDGPFLTGVFVVCAVISWLAGKALRYIFAGT